jgi:hypothetical protein
MGGYLDLLMQTEDFLREFEKKKQNGASIYQKIQFNSSK